MSSIFNKPKIIRLLKVAGIVYVILGFGLYFTQKLFLFHGKKLPNNYRFEFAEINVQDFTIKRGNSTNLNCALFLPTDTQHVSAVVIYYHGNQKNITRYQKFVTPFIANGMAVYMPDYPGFGKSTGPITEAIMKADAIKIYNQAKNKYPNSPILIYGKSMGTGLASYIAANNKVNRLVLETPYYNLPSVYDDFTWIYPTKLLLKFQFNNYEMLPKVAAPITIFHGTNDNLISLKNASKLKSFLKPNDEFVTINGGTHNNLFEQEIYFEKLDSVLSLTTSDTLILKK